EALRARRRRARRSRLLLAKGEAGQLRVACVHVRRLRAAEAELFVERMCFGTHDVRTHHHRLEPGPPSPNAGLLDECAPDAFAARGRIHDEAADLRVWVGFDRE